MLERNAGAVDTRIGHAQRLEERLPQEIAVGLPGDFLNDAAQQEVAGVVIVPLLSRVEVVGIVLKRFDQVIRRDGRSDLVHEARFVGVTADARRMGEEMA